MRRAVKRRGNLDRDCVLTTALALVDRDGAAALSMRNLGRELGVEAMSLYHYVRNRDDLLDGLVEVMVAAELPVPPRGEPWEEALSGFTAGIRRTALRHPEAFRLVGLRPLRSPVALGAIAGLLDCLRVGGFSPEAAVASYRLAAAYARGYALAEIEGLTLAAPQQPEVVPPELAEFSPALNADSTAMFERCLQTVVAGAAAQRDGRRAGAGTPKDRARR